VAVLDHILQATDAHLNKPGFSHIALIIGPFSSEGNLECIKALNV